MVGSDDQEAAAKVASLYLGIASPVVVTDPASAETIKYAANAFIATKLSFANAVAAVCEAVGADVERRDARPRLRRPHRSSVPEARVRAGAARACRRTPSALVRIAADGGYDFELLKGVIAVNDEQQRRVVEKVAVAAGGELDGAVVAVWGLTFKAGTDDLRNSPSLAICEQLVQRGAKVRAYDPTVRRLGMPAIDLARRHRLGVRRRLRARGPHRVGRVPLGRPRRRRPAHGPAGRGRHPQRARPGRAATGRLRLLRHRPHVTSGRRVVVAGGAGFIGSHLCERLLERGDEVVAVDNFLTGARANLVTMLGADGFSFVEHDVCEPLEVDGAVDAVLHLASPASPKDFATLPLEILAVGSDGTRNLLELARAKGARFLVTSTSEVYGEPLEHPQVESYRGNVSTTGPRSCYDEAKRFSEALTMAYHRTVGVDVAIARVFNTYGPRLKPGDGRVVSNFLVQAMSGAPITVYGDGQQTRSFCYVADEVDGLLALLDSTLTRPVNIGNPNEFTVGELAELVVELTGSKSRIVHEPLPVDDPTRRRPDITLAREKLGWEPRTDLRAGLTRTADWLRTVL